MTGKQHAQAIRIDQPPVCGLIAVWRSTPLNLGLDPPSPLP